MKRTYLSHSVNMPMQYTAIFRALKITVLVYCQETFVSESLSPSALGIPGYPSDVPPGVTMKRKIDKINIA